MYRLTTNPNSILREDDKSFIPVDTSNRDYREYLNWLSNGNSPYPILEPDVTVPKMVTMRQARLALLQVGKLNSVPVVIASLPSPDKEIAQIEWEYSSSVERDKQLVQLLAPALGLDDTALDNLFILAASL